MNIDVGELIKGVQQRLSVLAQPDKIVTELVELLRDTHQLLLKFESALDQLGATVKKWDQKLSDVDISPERLDRLERAVFNIERGTLGVEASMGALPRVVRARIDRSRRPGAGEPPRPRPGV